MTITANRHQRWDGNLCRRCYTEISRMRSQSVEADQNVSDVVRPETDWAGALKSDWNRPNWYELEPGRPISIVCSIVKSSTEDVQCKRMKERRWKPETEHHWSSTHVEMATVCGSLPCIQAYYDMRHSGACQDHVLYPACTLIKQASLVFCGVMLHYRKISGGNAKPISGLQFLIKHWIIRPTAYRQNAYALTSQFAYNKSLPAHNRFPMAHLISVCLSLLLGYVLYLVWAADITAHTT